MSIYQPNLKVFNATLVRNDQGDFVEFLDLTRKDSKGKTVSASKRDRKCLGIQLYHGIQNTSK